MSLHETAKQIIAEDDEKKESSTYRWIKLIEENGASLDSINLRIRQLLDED